MDRIKRGFYCAVSGCAIKPDGRVSFFHFPKDDPKRHLEWMKKCNRPELFQKDTKFLNGCRVCGKHFSDKMFSNSLKNRLNVLAVPELLLGGQENEITSIHLPKLIHHDNIATHINPSSDDLNVCISANTCSLKIRRIESLLPSTSKYENVATLQKPPPEMCTRQVQTDQSLSNNSPRMIKLKEEMKKVKSELKKLKIQHQTHIDNLTLSDFNNLSNKFLPPSNAKFVEILASLHNKAVNGKRYSKEYKKFALELYSISPKAYKFLQQTFSLPSIRLLQKTTRAINKLES